MKKLFLVNVKCTMPGAVWVEAEDECEAIREAEDIDGCEIDWMDWACDFEYKCEKEN